MSTGMMIYFVALGVLDAAFLLGCIYMTKCHKRDYDDEDDDGSGASLFFCIVGLGFIITSIVIADAGYNLANGT